MSKNKNWSKTLGPTEIRTQVRGIRILCDNQLHYGTHNNRSAPGIEPGTSSTLKTNHTPRPSGQLKFSKKWIDCSTFLCSINTMIKIRAAPTPQQLLLWLYLPTKIHPTFFQPSFLIHYSSSILFEGYGMDPSSF